METIGVNGEGKASIIVLDVERHVLFARIEAGGLSDREAGQLIKRHEALDWRIAKSTAKDLADIEIKIRRLAAQLSPMNEPMQAETLEHALILGILYDIHQLQ